MAVLPLTARDHIRGALILVHLIGIIGMALPSPKGLGSDPLSSPTVAAALAPWERGAAYFGVSPQLSHRGLVGGGVALVRARAALAWVFRPYAEYVGVAQHWSMFSASPDHATTFEFWLDEGEDWRLIYRPMAPSARWRAGLWEVGRVRCLLGAMAGRKFDRSWRALVESAARRAAADFPAATRFRGQRVPVQFPPPAELVSMGHTVDGEARTVVDVDLAVYR